MRWTIICDGGARGNPGPSASAFVVYRDEEPVFKAGFYWGRGTNNQAEYKALIMSLKWLISEIEDTPNQPVNIIMDSELVVKQLKGEYKIKSAKLRPLFNLTIRLIGKLKDRVELSYNPRQKTTSADDLVNQILDLKELGEINTAGRVNLYVKEKKGQKSDH